MEKRNKRASLTPFYSVKLIPAVRSQLESSFQRKKGEGGEEESDLLVFCIWHSGLIPWFCVPGGCRSADLAE